MSTLLLQEQGPEAEREVGGVGVDQDAEAQGDAGQTAGPRLGKQFVFFIRTKFLMQICIATQTTKKKVDVPPANRQGFDRSPIQSSFLEATLMNYEN